MFRTPTRLPVSPSTRPVLRSVAQLVEHRSPKPGVAGSIPAGPVRAAPSGAALSVPGNLCRRRSPAARDIAGRFLPGLLAEQGKPRSELGAPRLLVFLVKVARAPDTYPASNSNS